MPRSPMWKNDPPGPYHIDMGLVSFSYFGAEMGSQLRVACKRPYYPMTRKLKRGGLETAHLVRAFGAN